MPNDYTVARVSLDALTHNYELIKGRTSGGAKICPVIKADAYGHGAVRLAALYRDLGANYFAVARISEAAALRHSGIELPILILGHTAPSLAKELSELKLTQTVGSPEYKKELEAALDGTQRKLSVHIKIETGMSRLGFSQNELHTLGKEKCRALDICGAFTHFAVADTEGGEDFTRRQARKFSEGIDTLTEYGIAPEIKHAANSAAIISYPEYHFDMVRPGIILYGMPPSNYLVGAVPLRAAMTLESRITRVEELNPCESVGYGRAFVAERKTKIATVPIGYADGIPRNAAQNGVTLSVNGTPARIVGRVCMDQLMLDVTDIPSVRAGDTVTVLGGEGENSAHSLAERFSTISYELLTGISGRIARIYE